MAFALFQSVLGLVVHRQPPSHGLTTPVGRFCGATRWLSCPTSPAFASCDAPARVVVTGFVCACTHYLVFKEPTDQSSLERLEAFCRSGAQPLPWTVSSAAPPTVF